MALDETKEKLRHHIFQPDIMQLKFTIVAAIFFLATTICLKADESKHIAVLDYKKAQQVMARQDNPYNTAFQSGLDVGFHLFVEGWFGLAGHEAYMHWDSIKKTTADVYKSLFDNGKISNNDVKNIQTIIETGRANHVDEMDVTISREQFIGLKATLPTPEKTFISFEGGSDGKTAYGIKVKYK